MYEVKHTGIYFVRRGNSRRENKYLGTLDLDISEVKLSVDRTVGLLAVRTMHAEFLRSTIANLLRMHVPYPLLCRVQTPP